MNKETMIKFMTELKAFCEEYRECEKCELDDCCRIAFEKGTLPFEWKMPDENKRWRAEKYENYWYVDDRGVAMETTDNRFNGDNYHYTSHNYFRTEEEAKEYAKVLETEMLLRQFADENNYKAINWNDDEEPKYHMSYKYDNHSIAIYVDYLSCDTRTVYFNSKRIAQQAIETIGKDRLIDYLTYKW